MGITAVFAGLITGIVLGVFGSGGSIVTTPALLYLLHVEPKPAIAMSLGIVAVTASITAIQHWRCGNVHLKVAFIFGLFGIVGTFAGAKLGVVTPVAVQLGLFALVMYAAGYKMLRPGTQQHKAVGAAVVVVPADDALAINRVHIAIHGLAVGVLTGVVGVGGGFLIVPALVLLSRLPMKQAVGTSLLIVAAKSYAGFAGYMGAVDIDYPLMAVFAAVAVGGSFLGTLISHRVSGEVLKRGFAVFLMLVATYIVVKSVL